MNELKPFRFGKGSHKSRKDGMCVMEAVAYLNNEQHSDSPACACPVITKLAIWVNDNCSDDLRQELLLDLPWRLVGTKSTPEIERRRGYMAADWAVRCVAPIVLRRAKLNKEADSLEALSEVNDNTSANAAYAAANAADTAASLDKIIRSCVQLIDRMIRLTEPQEQACHMRTRQRELLGI